MPFKLTKKGYVQDPKGTLRLPQAPPAFAKLPGLKITQKTPVKPALKKKPGKP